MYYKENADQLGIDEFFLPFGGKLKKDNRWVKAAEIMPWDYIEEVYLRSMSQETGRGAFPARIAYGAIYVREQEQLTDEETVIAIAENPYIQYFLGLKEFRDEPLFDASMMVHFRKRFPFEELAKINDSNFAHRFFVKSCLNAPFCKNIRNAGRDFREEGGENSADFLLGGIKSPEQFCEKKLDFFNMGIGLIQQSTRCSNSP